LQDAVLRRTVIGPDVPYPSEIVGGEARVESPNENVEGSTGLSEIAKTDVYACRRDSASNSNYEVPIVVSDFSIEEIDRPE